MPRSQTVHILPEWDVVAGNFRVARATARGMGAIRGETRETFHDRIREALPEGGRAVVEHPGAPVVLAQDGP